MGELLLVLVASSAVFFQLSAATFQTGKCKSGRIFIGNVNETFPQHLDRVGVYVEQSEKYNERPTYKHENQEFYMYYVSGFMEIGYWVVGSSVGGDTAGFSVQTNVPQPSMTRQVWHMQTESGWIPEQRLNAVCVEASFGPCASESLQLLGISPISNMQRQHQGYFFLQANTHELRPVYQHNETGEYLYYHNGMWMVGPELGKPSGSLFVVDYAFSPELIVHHWVVFNGWQFVTDTGVQIKCTETSMASANGATTEPTVTPISSITESNTRKHVHDLSSVAVTQAPHSDTYISTSIFPDEHDATSSILTASQHAFVFTTTEQPDNTDTWNIVTSLTVDNGVEKVESAVSSEPQHAGILTTSSLHAHSASPKILEHPVSSSVVVETATVQFTKKKKVPTATLR